MLMASYCKRCGNVLFDGLCRYCGKDHERRPVEEATGHLKRKIKKHFHLPHISKVIIVVLIVALAVIVSYLLFSKEIDQTLYKATSQEKNQIIQDQISGQATQVKEFLNIKPQLSVFHQMVSKFDFERGCFGRVNGGVTNKGTDDALNIIVTCTTQSGVTVQQNIGYIAAGKTELFEIFLNYDCSIVQKEECSATCSNC
jgi:cell division protein FtsL